MDREPDQTRLNGDIPRIAQRLGWRPRVPLREGLARTLAFYAEHAARYWDAPRPEGAAATP